MNVGELLNILNENIQNGILTKDSYIGKPDNWTDWDNITHDETVDLENVVIKQTNDNNENYVLLNFAE